MSAQDRRRWDERYRHTEPVSSLEPPPVLEGHLALVPNAGNALDIACGQGQGALWMASQGLTVLGLDISSIAVGQGREAARRLGLTDRCRFEVHDLDVGLPAPTGSPERYDMILCHLFRNPTLYPGIMERLAPGGLLVIVTLSGQEGRVGAYRAEPGELAESFADLTIHDSGRDRSRTWLVATNEGTEYSDHAAFRACTDINVVESCGFPADTVDRDSG